MLRRACTLLGGLYQLARLGVLTRFRFGGAYWSWRMHTAFGHGDPPPRVELLHAIVRYGCWMHRMRGLR